MIAFKKKYFFIIETINDIDLKKFKKFNKFNIIYRNKNYLENIDKLKKFVQLCRSKHISFFVANNVSLARTDYENIGYADGVDAEETIVAVAFAF